MPKPMSGEQIAKDLGITRQAVSNSLKRAMRKCYLHIKGLYPELSPVGAAVIFMRWLSEEGELEFDTNEINKFIRLFPLDIRKEIDDDMKKQSIYTVLESVTDILN